MFIIHAVAQSGGAPIEDIDTLSDQDDQCNFNFNVTARTLALYNFMTKLRLTL